MYGNIKSLDILYRKIIYYNNDSHTFCTCSFNIDIMTIESLVPSIYWYRGKDPVKEHVVVILRPNVRL